MDSIIDHALLLHLEVLNDKKIIKNESVDLIVTSPPYGVSKAGVINLTQAWALELAEFNINVNAICPGLLWTPMWQRIAHRWSFDEEKWKGYTPRQIFDSTIKDRIPLGREQTPEDIAYVAAFLASDYANNITGQAINVNGGSHMN